jgi:hypothetical protein
MRSRTVALTASRFVSTQHAPQMRDGLNLTDEALLTPKSSNCNAMTKKWIAVARAEK